MEITLKRRGITSLGITFRTVMVVALAVFALFAAGPRNARAHVENPPTEQAINALVNGPEVKNLHLYNWRFHVRPVMTSVVGEKILVSGLISREIKWAPNDRALFSFTIDRQSGMIVGAPVVNVQPGGLKGYLRYFKQFYSQFKQAVSPGQSQAAGQQVEQQIQKGQRKAWEDVVDMLLLHAAARIAQKYAPTLPTNPTPDATPMP